MDKQIDGQIQGWIVRETDGWMDVQMRQLLESFADKPNIRKHLKSANARLDFPAPVLPTIPTL